MDYNSSYSSYNGSQVGGGGFLASHSQGVDMSMSMSQMSPSNMNMNGSSNRTNNSGGQSGGSKQYVQSLVPLTIKQIRECVCRDSKFYIDRREVLQVSFVALVISFEVQQTNISYWLSDGSGDLNCRLYIDNPAEGSMGGGDKHGTNVNDIKEHTYVRVIGKLSSRQDQVQVIAVHISPVVDHNQITYHMLDALATHLRNTREPVQNQNGQGGIKMEQSQRNSNPYSNNNNNTINSSSSSSNSRMMNSNSGMGGASSGMDAGQSNSGSIFTAVQRQILSIFQANTSDQGASLDEVISKLPGVSAAEIRAAVDFLSNDGHLYSTIDDDHYKLTSQ